MVRPYFDTFSEDSDLLGMLEEASHALEGFYVSAFVNLVEGLPCDITCDLINPSSIDWTCSLAVNSERSAPLHDVHSLVAIMRAAHRLASTWGKRTEPALSELIEKETGLPFRAVGKDFWLLGDSLYLADLGLRSFTGEAGVLSEMSPPDVEAEAEPYSHPDFRAHFVADIYYTWEGELNPFGSDEGNDLLVDWAGRRDQLAGMTLAEVLAGEGCGPDEDRGVDSSQIRLSMAFVMLRLDGRIDREGLSIARGAVADLAREYGWLPTLLQQDQDLAAWGRRSGFGATSSVARAPLPQPRYC